MKKRNKYLILFMILVVFSLMNTQVIYAADPFPEINLTIGGDDAGGATTSLQMIILFTFIAVSPSLLIMLTAFTRISISLSFLRTAMGTGQQPSNQVMIGMAVILTLFVMSPTFEKINDNAIIPYTEGTMTNEEFFEEAMNPIREFMFSQMKVQDLELFSSFAGITSYSSVDDVPNTVLIPSFVVSEVTKGFLIGFLLYVPFVVIDMVVASVLMAMGMMMLPPAMISAPFKIIFFIMIDGWNVLIGSILRTFTQG